MNITSSFEKLNYHSDYLKFILKNLGIDKSEIIKLEYNVNVITFSWHNKNNLPSEINIINIEVEGHE